MKNAFFWGIACWNSSKITNFENFTHFQGFFTRLPIFASFGGSYGKKILKKGQMSWNWSHLSGKHDFWAKFSSRAKIDRGAPGVPPRTWQGLSDVALIRVKNKLTKTSIQVSNLMSSGAKRGKKSVWASTFEWPLFQRVLKSNQGSESVKEHQSGPLECYYWTIKNRKVCLRRFWNFLPDWGWQKERVHSKCTVQLKAT